MASSSVKSSPGATPAKHEKEPAPAPPKVSATPSNGAPRVVNAFRYAVPMPTRAELLNEPVLPDSKSCSLVFSSGSSGELTGEDKNEDGSLKEFGEW